MDLFILRTWLQAKFRADERGASMVEYGMLLLFIAVLSLVAIKAFGEQTSARLSGVSTSIN